MTIASWVGGSSNSYPKNPWNLWGFWGVKLQEGRGVFFFFGGNPWMRCVQTVKPATVTLHTLDLSFVCFCFNDFLVIGYLDVNWINLHVIILSSFRQVDGRQETSKHFEIVNLAFAAVSFFLLCQGTIVCTLYKVPMVFLGYANVRFGNLSYEGG